MTVAPVIVDYKDNRLRLEAEAVFFLSYLLFIKRAASAISTIAKAKSASYVTIPTKVRMTIHRHHSFLIEIGRSKNPFQKRRSNRHRNDALRAFLPQTVYHIKEKMSTKRLVQTSHPYEPFNYGDRWSPLQM